MYFFSTALLVSLALLTGFANSEPLPTQGNTVTTPQSEFTNTKAPNPNYSANNSYLSIQVGIDTEGLILAADQISAATQDLSRSIKHVSENPNLTPQQQQQLYRTLSQIGEISTSLNNAIIQLPLVIEQSRQPLFGILSDTGDKITKMLFVLGLLIIVLLGAIFWVFYRLVLHPVQSAIVQTSSNLSVLSQSLQHTAQIVDGIQQQTAAPKGRKTFKRLPQR